MNELINLIKTLGVNVFENHATIANECIVYSYNTTYADKIIKRIRLKLTIIAKTTARCEELEAAINDLILTFADEPVADILVCSVNGGGTLYDEARNMQHTILYYDIVKKY